MKVKCISIFNKNSYLEIGKEYAVLQLEIYLPKKVIYRLVADTNYKMPALYEPEQFEVTSNLIPSNWVIDIFDESIMLGPKAWAAIGFWEDCYDMDEKALEIYRRESWIIFEEENLFP